MDQETTPKKKGLKIWQVAAMFVFAVWFVNRCSEGSDAYDRAAAKVQAEEKFSRTDTIAKTSVVNAFKGFRKESDEIQEATWYHHKNTPMYNNVNNIAMFVGVRESGAIRPWFSVNYRADDWLFFHTITFKTDNATYTFDGLRPKRDHSGGEVWEFLDAPMDDEYYIVFQDIAQSKKVLMRLTGTQYTKDRTITEKEKKALRETLAAYQKVK